MRPWPYFRIVLLTCALVVAMAATVLALSFQIFGGLERDAAKVMSEGETAYTLVELGAAAREVELFAAEEHLERQGIEVSRRTSIETVDETLLRIRDMLPAVEESDAVAPDEFLEAIVEMRAAFLAYIEERSDSSLSVLALTAREAQQTSEGMLPITVEETRSSFDAVLSSLRAHEWLMLVTTFAIVPAVVGMLLWNGRKLGTAVANSHDRERALMESNRALARRNEQFAGVYRVVTEVTETLSVKYVVETTVREVHRLVEADLVVLRSLEGNVLRLLGTEPRHPGEEIEVPAEVMLGEGLDGRAAKLGRILRVNARDEHDHSFEDAPLPAAQSALVVPLIVGAQVVGTITCYSLREDALDEDHERALEMMASQVATAIAAASSHEGTEHDAAHDALTGLPNRRQLADDMRWEYNAAVHRGRATAAAMIDIDHFKRFNDQHGHHAGDVALQQVAAILSEGIRADDRIYRYGGEEFLIVFDKLGANEAREACERLRARVAATPVLQQGSVHVTVSIGIASAPELTTDFEELVSLADEALYRSKMAGRDRVTVYTGPGPGGDAGHQGDDDAIVEAA